MGFDRDFLKLWSESVLIWNESVLILTCLREASMIVKVFRKSLIRPAACRGGRRVG